MIDRPRDPGDLSEYTVDPTPEAKRLFHIARHLVLHHMLVELIADFLTHNRDKSLSATLLDLVQWSHRQTTDPDETA